jgi:hypothetical protein
MTCAVALGADDALAPADSARILVLSTDGAAIERSLELHSMREVQGVISPLDPASRDRMLVFPGRLGTPNLDDITNPRGQPVGPGEAGGEQNPKELTPEQRRRFEEFQKAARQQEIWRQCEEVALSFRGQLQSYEKNVSSLARPPDELLAEARRYESICLAGPAHGSVGLAANDALRERIGTLAVAQQPFCSAYLWDPTHLLTARHCFQERVGVARPDVLRQLGEGEIRFERLSEPGVAYEVVRLIEPAGLSAVSRDPISTRIDFVYLELSQAVTASSPAPAIADAQPWATALVAGHFPYASPVAADGTALSASHSIRWGKVGCVVKRTSGACVYHACQSVRGFSGAPIFALQGETVQFVGLHTEANGGSGECVVAGYATGNVGVAATRIRRYPPGL